MLSVSCLKIYINSLQQDNLQDSGAQESGAPSENIVTVARDPRYARYLKMVQVVSFAPSFLSNPGDFTVIFSV